jgi:hypothetical protein
MDSRRGTAESSAGCTRPARPVPAGTAENYPGWNPGVRLPLKWTIRDSGQPTQDCVLGHFQPSLAGLVVCIHVPRTHVLGYSQPSLRDSIWRA